MIDPLAEVVTLLQPGTPFSKVVSAAGTWGIRRSVSGDPFYCVILKGTCWLTMDGKAPLLLQQDDFVLIPAAEGFIMTSQQRIAADDFCLPVALQPGHFRLGAQSGQPEVQTLVGHCVFGSPDASLLVSLLPELVHIRGEKRLATLLQLVGDECRAQRPAREVVLARLLEVMLIEALRSTSEAAASPGLLRGMADERLASAITKMHEQPTFPWTVAQLAKEAALSRSTFFERFRQAVGVAPMAYLLGWRMAMAKNLLLRKEGGIAEVAERVGYNSASAFSVAFTRHVGIPPTRYSGEEPTPPEEASAW